MNRYLIVGRSLLTDSKILRLAIGLAILFALMGAVLQVTVAVGMMAALGAMSLGESAYRYRRWEPGQIVPNLNPTYGRVIVLVTLFIWAMVALTIFVIDGFLLIRMGLALFVMAVGLRVGYGGRIALFPIFIGALFGSTYFFRQLPDEWVVWSVQLFDGKTGYSLLVGALAMLSGGFQLWRVECRASRKTERESSSLWWEGVAFFDSEALLATRRFPSKSAFSRMRLTVNETMLGSPCGVAIVVALAAFYLGLMFFARGNAFFSVPAQWLAAMLLIWSPLFYLIYDVPRVFQRIWVLGVSESRVETFRTLLWVRSSQFAPMLVVVVIGLVVQCPVRLIDYSSLACILLFGLGSGGVLMWFVAKFYASIKGTSDAVQLGVIGLSVVLSALVMTWFQEMHPLHNIVESVGPALSISILALFSGAIWVFGIYDAPRQLANETALMD